MEDVMYFYEGCLFYFVVAVFILNWFLVIILLRLSKSVPLSKKLYSRFDSVFFSIVFGWVAGFFVFMMISAVTWMYDTLWYWYASKISMTVSVVVFVLSLSAMLKNKNKYSFDLI